MKKALHPTMMRPDSSSLHDQRKPHAKNYFKVVSRKLAGVFTALLSGKRKKGSIDVNKMQRNNTQVKRISCKFFLVCLV